MEEKKEMGNIRKLYGLTDERTQMAKIRYLQRLQTTQPTSGGAITANSSCCANCGRTSPPPAVGARFTVFLGMPAMRTRWMAGAVAHKSG